MTQVTRATLPGSYDALTDANLDHYSVYSDIDNVLIKRFTKAQPTIPGGTDVNFAHNLGYVPFFMSYYSTSTGIWQIFNNQYNAFSDVDALAIDTSKLYFHNSGAFGDLQPTYDIFYDDMDQAGTPSITETKNVIKIIRPSYDSLTDKNPNHYIMHSDLNNFKILKQGTTSINASSGNHTYSFAHGFNGQAPYKYFCYLKFPDGKTLLTGTAAQSSYDESHKFIVSTMDATNINISGTFGSDITIEASYIIYGTGADNTINNSGYVISVAEDGYDALTATNPDNFKFHSNYPTLKYFQSGSYDMGNISTTTTHTIAHNLGYVPFFIGFAKDLEGFFINSYAIMPYFSSHSSLATPKNNVACWIYADETNIYLKTWYDVNMTTTYHPIFYYKILKNNLRL